MEYEKLSKEDREYYTQKLVATGGDKWLKLSEEVKKKMIEEYDESSSFDHLEVRELIRRVRDRRLTVVALVMGVFLGVIGGLFATIINTWLENFGLPYNIGVIFLSIGCFIGVMQLPELIANENLKEGKLFEKLLTAIGEKPE